jgi:adenosylcobinamide-GDP ribazoletransferase
MERVEPRSTGSSGAVVSVRAALGLLTRLPVGRAAAEAPGAAAFAVVGAAVGCLGAVPLVLLALAGEPVLGAFSSVAVLAAVSGGLHLDGLADTADALAASGAVAAERARKDPAVGPAGAATLLLVLGGQVAALASVSQSSGAVMAGSVVVVAGAVSRCLPVLAVVLLRRRVGPDGLGAWFSARVSAGDAIIAAATVAITVAGAAVLAGWAIAVAALAGTVVGIAVTALVARIRGRLDGDGLGASVEIALTATVVSLAVIAP